jgi:hypothetical protein
MAEHLCGADSGQSCFVILENEYNRRSRSITMDVLAFLVEVLAERISCASPDFVSRRSRQQGAGDDSAGEAKEDPACVKRRHRHSFHFPAACLVSAQASAYTLSIRGKTLVVKSEFSAA